VSIVMQPSSSHTGGDKQTAFVLSGGASLGAMQAGMLRALYESGIVPDLIVATSAGALNAAFIASRPQTVDTAHELAMVWRDLHRDDIFPLHPRQVFSGLANRQDHLVPDSGMRKLAGTHLDFERLEDAQVPVHLVAFDLRSGSEVLLSSGPALEAVLASAAIPGVLPPVEIGEMLLVDGGIVNNTPISHAVELGAERVYVLPTDDAFARGVSAPPRGALDAAVHAFMLLSNARQYADLEHYAGQVELIVLPADNTHHVQPTDFGHATRLIGAAHAAARELLAESAIETLAA
jgi:NTE family protein